VVHGLVVGWSNYWHAVVAWRVGGEVGVLAHDRPKLFVGSLGQVAPDLLGLACVALAGAVWCLRRRTPRGGAPLWVAPAWLLVAFAGLNVGGLYWEHYYVQLVAPLALLAAIAVTAVRRRAVAAALVTAAIAPVAVTLGGWALASPDERVEVVQFAHHYERDRAVARFIDAHSRPTDTIYALSSQGDLYFLAHRRSAERYLWAHPLREIPGGMDDLRRVLAGPHPPRYVAVFRRPNVVDPTGRLKAILATRYHFRWKGPVDGIRVLEPNGVRPG
jgi:hypothetical protein